METNRSLNGRYVIDVNNVDFSEQLQGKYKLVFGPLRYRINIAAESNQSVETHIPRKNSR